MSCGRAPSARKPTNGRPTHEHRIGPLPRGRSDAGTAAAGRPSSSTSRSGPRARASSGGRHARAVLGDGRGAYPAAPARQGPRLGDRRVRDAAPRDVRAEPARVRQGPAGWPDARDPAAHRPLPARRRRHREARRADRDHRLRRAPGRRRHAHRVDHRRLRRARARAPLARPGAGRGRPDRGGQRRHRRWRRMLDLDYSEDSRAEVDFNVVGTDAGTYVEVQGTAEGKPFDRPSMDRLLALADDGLRQLFDAPGLDTRASPTPEQRFAVGRRGGLLVADRSPHKLGELRSCSTCRGSSSSRSMASASPASPSRTAPRSAATRSSRRASTPSARGCPRSPTTPDSRSTRWAAGPACARGATRARSHRRGEQRQAARRAGLAGRPEPEARGARYRLRAGLPRSPCRPDAPVLADRHLRRSHRGSASWTRRLRL